MFPSSLLKDQWPMLPFFTLKKLFKVDIFGSNLKNSSNIKTIFTRNTKNRPEYLRKMYFMSFFLFFSGGFGDSYGKAGDLVCTSGRLGITRESWHRCYQSENKLHLDSNKGLMQSAEKRRKDNLHLIISQSFKEQIV